MAVFVNFHCVVVVVGGGAIILYHTYRLVRARAKTRALDPGF